MSNIKIYPNETILNKSCVVYQIENDITQDAYVGYTKGKLKVRYSSHNGCHSSSVHSNCDNRTSLYRDFKKYGKSNFTMRILNTATNKTQLLELEKTYQVMPKYKKYNEQSKNRNTSSGKNKDMIILLIDEKGNRSYYENPIDVARSFNVHRSSIIKAINNAYKFKRKYVALFVPRYSVNKEQLNLF
ncbi:GIY-YIG nuclease family protein [Tenacibaculum finnmarkense]|uniref:GIY-YIG nuclease family protein n=1 Tax=Tenacibaculum finnmarkense TaxID=2781243 RepID=UPI001EFADC9D|nr:GIY-YIG nuclease family protein [Tenacibaculum finnmarkense]MCG8867984.1 GIY-YIG nuclease family protein [Tenacibaculum finnmarkense]MCG8878611.1 GIY-YIG nuclease family protein [Tenacibaculum finnmarkense]MCG8897515.1 GIY-YIG nuclease family protein [Tenacibaculum finnmarkense]